MLRLGLLLSLLLLQACATAPYRWGTGREDIDLHRYPQMSQQVYQGAPHSILDASDWYWPNSLLGKLLLWDRDIDSHEISDCTLAHLEQFLRANGMNQVQVLANRYAPGNQWIRLFKNKTVGAGWRYTLGLLSVATYTILPGRFFGGDAYNPYTNTIYLYSDDPAIALHEAGHAKDFAERKYKGTHAFIYALPLAALYYEARASNQALSYSLALANAEQLKDEYELLYPAYATYVGGSFIRQPWLGAAGVIPGHIAGRIASARSPDELTPQAGPAIALDPVPPPCRPVHEPTLNRTPAAATTLPMPATPQASPEAPTE